jgi:hypothetical protein
MLRSMGEMTAAPTGGTARRSVAVALARLGARTRLAVIVLVATVLWGAVASLSASPWIFADELIYAELARSLADGSAPAIRGVAGNGYGVVYPLLLAPLWALAPDVATAYALAHWVGAAIMALAAIPAYLLARRFVGERSALIVSALTVAVPSMAYTATILTEVALYPAFLLAVWLIARALERPTASAQLIALAAIALAAATKVVALALLGAYLAAIALLALLARAHDGERLRRTLRPYRATALALAVGLALLVVVVVARGISPLAPFGAYSEAVRSVDPLALPVGVVRHLGVLALYMAVVPLAATAVVVVLGLRSGAARADRALAALVATVVGCVLGAVAVFSSFASTVDYQATGTPSATPLTERNVFMLVPLLLVGLAAWAERGMPLPRRLSLAVAAACTALVVVYPWRLLPDSVNPQNLVPTAWTLATDVPWVLSLLAGAVAAAAAAFWLRLPAARRPRVWVVPGVWFAFTGLLAVTLFTGASGVAADTGRGAPADWIDRAVGGGEATVAVVWAEPPTAEYASPREAQRVVWVSEFFNRSVGPVYSLGARLPFGLPDIPVRLSASGALVERDGGRAVVARYALGHCELALDAPVVAVDRGASAVLYRTDGPVRLLPGSSPAC